MVLQRNKKPKATTKKKKRAIITNVNMNSVH